MLEFLCAQRIQLAIQISVQQRSGKFTSHGAPPSRRGDEECAAAALAPAPEATSPCQSEFRESPRSPCTNILPVPAKLKPRAAEPANFPGLSSAVRVRSKPPPTLPGSRLARNVIARRIPSSSPRRDFSPARYNRRCGQFAAATLANRLREILRKNDTPAPWHPALRPRHLRGCAAASEPR